MARRLPRANRPARTITNDQVSAACVRWGPIASRGRCSGLQQKVKSTLHPYLPTALLQLIDTSCPQPLSGFYMLRRCQMDVEQEVHPPRQFLDPHRQAAAAGSSDFLTPGMRMIVASWMVEVAEEFRLQQETLHLATGLLDRFLSSTQVRWQCSTVLGYNAL